METLKGCKFRIDWIEETVVESGPRSHTYSSARRDKLIYENFLFSGSVFCVREDCPLKRWDIPDPNPDTVENMKSAMLSVAISYVRVNCPLRNEKSGKRLLI